MKRFFSISACFAIATLFIGCETTSSSRVEASAAFLRPPGIDVGNVNSAIAGTINPGNLGQGGIVSPGHH
jgi:hypothetical protein